MGTLMDTPRCNALTIHATTLRTKLKHWEKSFAASHSGQRPGKEDIKASIEITNAYKEYNRLRDVLAGKQGVESLKGATRRSPSTYKIGKSGNAERAASDAEADRGTICVFSPSTSREPPRRRRNLPHPNLLDPYDPPVSASPKPYPVTAIGPTPQRDGKVLGLFDLLSNSGNSSQATPSTRKRKVDCLANIIQGDASTDDRSKIAQTPSRKRMRDTGTFYDMVDQNGGHSPKGNPRHSRTPTSEGKKFMLSQFFATPSTMCFAAIADDQDELRPAQTMGQGAEARRTPLRTHVLGVRANGVMETELPALDATPTYLKRSYSFKDRLLSASASGTGTADLRKTKRPGKNAIKTGPPTLWRYKAGPRPLSEIVRGLRQMDDGRYADDLDALQEIEGGRIVPFLGESQMIELGAKPTDGGLEEEVAAADESAIHRSVWKKKGQKRSTRRVNMRPVKLELKKENQWVAEDSENERREDSDLIEETQYANRQTPSAQANEETSLPANDLQKSRRTELESTEAVTRLDNQESSAPNAKTKGNSDYEELNDSDEPSKSKEGGKKTRNNIHVATAQSAGSKVKGKDKVTPIKTKQKGHTINPNAVSHQNFRTLKIRNKNSKAKGGRGRFGRKGR